MGRLKGIWVPILTPQKDNLSIDRDRFFNHLQWLFANGIDGIVIFGTNGEGTSFSTTERMALLDWVKDENIPSEKIMVGTGCSAFSDTVTLSQHAVSHGFYHQLMLPPFYYKNPSQTGLVSYFSEVIQRINDSHLQIYLYNFPQLSGINLDAELVAELIEIYPQQIIGYKDSSGNWENTKKVLKLCPGITMFPGSEVYLSKVLAAGGAGVISGTANVNPSNIKETYNVFFKDQNMAASHQDDITAFRRAVQSFPLIAGLKGLIQHHRSDETWKNMRPPLSALSHSEFDQLLNSIQSLKYTLAD